MGGCDPRARREYLTGSSTTAQHRAGTEARRSRVACARPPVQAQQEVSPVAKLSFLAGFGAGYVLGARAGHERYDQIRRAWEQAKDDPRLQSLAGMAQAKADDAVSTLKAQLGSEPPR